MSAELTFRNQVGEQIVRNPSRCQAGRVAGRAAASNVGGTGYVLSGCGRSGAAFSKLRFLGVIGAKLRAEVLPGGRAPDFHVAIAGAERLAAEHAAARAAVHEIPAAREHRNLSTNLGYLNGASRFVNA
jgi:hypothetical protein